MDSVTSNGLWASTQGLARKALTAGLLAGLLVSCSASSVLQPPEAIPTGSIAPPSAPGYAPSLQMAGETAGRLPAAPSSPIEARPPATYGAPAADISALPSYDTLSSGQPTPRLAASGNSAPAIARAASREDTVQTLGVLQGGRALPAPQTEFGAQSGPQTSAQSNATMAAPVSVAPDAPERMAASASAENAPSSSGPLSSLPGASTPPVASPAAEQRAEPRRLAGLLPRSLNPMAGRRPATHGLPASEAACQQRLKRLGVQFTAKPAVGNGGSCGIAHPVEVSALSGNVRVSPATTLNCEMAEAFATWVGNDLAPGVRKRYLTGIHTIGSMGGYSCRTMNSRRGAPMSEHATGNAIDIGSIKLNSGKDILVRKKGFFAFREKSLLKNVRGDGCRYFTTVLGPGSDANHADHFHFDLRDRKSGYRHCD